MSKEINMDKIKQFTKEINGIVYTAQFMGLRNALKAEKLYTDERTGRVDKEKLYDYILDNVIISPPGLDIDKFDDLTELDEVAAFGVQVLRNRFRPQDSEDGRGESGAESETATRSKK